MSIDLDIAVSVRRGNGLSMVEGCDWDVNIRQPENKKVNVEMMRMAFFFIAVTPFAEQCLSRSQHDQDEL